MSLPADIQRQGRTFEALPSAALDALQEPPVAIRREPVMVMTGHEDRTDPVLKSGLVNFQDEREWNGMLRCPPIGSSMQQRKSLVHAAATSVKAGKSNSSNAHMLAEFVECAISTMDSGNYSSWQQELLDIVPLGWVPTQLAWSPDFRFEGKAYWRVKEVQAERPWNFVLSKRQEDGRRFIARRTQIWGGVGQDEWSDPDLNARWHIAKWGSSNSPYGQSALHNAWYVYKLRELYQRQQQQGVNMSMGVLKMSKKASGSAKSTTELQNEIQTTFNRLREFAILYEGEDFAHDWMSLPAYLDGHLALTEYLDTELRIMLTGQNLSQKVESGALASTKEHVKEILGGILTSDAQGYSAALTRFARMLVDANFVDTPPDDYPVVMSRHLTRIDPERVRAFVDLGGAQVDGVALAEEWRIPLPEGTESLLLGSNQQQSADLFPPTRSAAPSLASRGQLETADGVAELLDLAQQESQENAEEALKGIASALAESYLRARPDPKARPR